MKSKNKTIDELYAMPEIDGWVYSDGESMNGPQLVAQIYKQAGLFGNLAINGNEFTAKDVY